MESKIDFRQIFFDVFFSNAISASILDPFWEAPSMALMDQSIDQLLDQWINRWIDRSIDPWIDGFVLDVKSTNGKTHTELPEDAGKSKTDSESTFFAKQQLSR